jgi:hypothetical protein
MDKEIVKKNTVERKTLRFFKIFKLWLLITNRPIPDHVLSLIGQIRLFLELAEFSYFIRPKWIQLGHFRPLKAMAEWNFSIRPAAFPLGQNRQKWPPGNPGSSQGCQMQAVHLFLFLRQPTQSHSAQT